MNEHYQRELMSPGHEPIETDVRAIWRTGAVLAVVVMAAFLLIVGMMNWFGNTAGRPPLLQQTVTDPDWNAPLPLQELRSREQQLSSSYQWVDQPAGIARIPVERAMEIVSTSGLPTTIDAGTNSTGDNNQ